MKAVAQTLLPHQNLNLFFFPLHTPETGLDSLTPTKYSYIHLLACPPSLLTLLYIVHNNNNTDCLSF